MNADIISRYTQPEEKPMSSNTYIKAEEAWCHRDDANPMGRLYVNHSGEHHTVKEWIVTKAIFRNFYGFY